MRCHLYKWHKSPVEAVEFLKSVFSIDKLQQLDIQSKLSKAKRPKIDLEELEKELKRQA